MCIVWCVWPVHMHSLVHLCDKCIVDCGVCVCVCVSCKRSLVTDIQPLSSTACTQTRARAPHTHTHTRTHTHTHTHTHAQIHTHIHTHWHTHTHKHTDLLVMTMKANSEQHGDIYSGIYYVYSFIFICHFDTNWYTNCSQKLANSEAIVFMRVDYSLRMEALFQILRPCRCMWRFASEIDFVWASTLR